MEVVNRSVLQKSKNKLTLFVILQNELYFTSVQIFKISIYFNQKATTDAFFVTTFIVVLFYGRWEVLRVASPLFQRLFCRQHHDVVLAARGRGACPMPCCDHHLQFIQSIHPCNPLIIFAPRHHYSNLPTSSSISNRRKATVPKHIDTDPSLALPSKHYQKHKQKQQ